MPGQSNADAVCWNIDADSSVGVSCDSEDSTRVILTRYSTGDCTRLHEDQHLEKITWLAKKSFHRFVKGECVLWNATNNEALEKMGTDTTERALIRTRRNLTIGIDYPACVDPAYTQYDSASGSGSGGGDDGTPGGGSGSGSGSCSGISCEMPWTNCADLSGSCIITEHSAPEWKGAIVTIAQSGCSAAIVADNGKDEVTKSHMTVWQLAQGAGGAFSPLTSNITSHDFIGHWASSAGQDPASNQPTIDIMGKDGTWHAKMDCGITFAYQYHGCYNHQAGGDADGNFMDGKVRSVQSLDECAGYCKAKNMPLIGITDIDCPDEEGTFDCHCGWRMPYEQMSDDDCKSCSTVAAGSSHKCGGCGWELSVYSYDSSAYAKSSSSCDDSKCSSIGDDCCAPGEESATCRDGYTPLRTERECLFSARAEYECCMIQQEGGAVVRVSAGQSTDMLGNHDVMLVLFCAGWAPSCQGFDPIFAQAATRLRAMWPGVQFARIDEPVLMHSMMRYSQTEGVPTLLWLRRRPGEAWAGVGQSSDPWFKDYALWAYSGGYREEEIVVWVDMMMDVHARGRHTPHNYRLAK